MMSRTSVQDEDSGQKQNQLSSPSKRAATLVWPAVALLCWTVCSSGLILLNKELMVADGFNYPMALTAAGQLTSYIGGIKLAPSPPCLFQCPLSSSDSCSTMRFAFAITAHQCALPLRFMTGFYR